MRLLLEVGCQFAQNDYFSSFLLLDEWAAKVTLKLLTCGMLLASPQPFTAAVLPHYSIFPIFQTVGSLRTSQVPSLKSQTASTTFPLQGSFHSPAVHMRFQGGYSYFLDEECLF